MSDPPNDDLDSATRAQVAEFLRLTPAERLRSLMNTVSFIQRARLRMHQPAEPRTVHELLRQLRERK